MKPKFRSNATSLDLLVFWLFVAAFVVQYAGLLMERWVFFAQANHPQNLYYRQSDFIITVESLTTGGPSRFKSANDYWPFAVVHSTKIHA